MPIYQRVGILDGLSGILRLTSLMIPSSINIYYMGARIPSSGASRRSARRGEDAADKRPDSQAKSRAGQPTDGAASAAAEAPPSSVGQRRFLTLKEMVNGAGTTARAVRFYESQKLIQSVNRSRGGHRQFDLAELQKLRLVIDLRTCGFSIPEIREVLEAKGRGATVRESAQAVQGLLGSHIQELQRKIAVIERLGREFSASLQVLERCANCTDPRGALACPSCEVPRQAPPSFHQIWAVASFGQGPAVGPGPSSKTRPGKAGAAG